MNKRTMKMRAGSALLSALLAACVTAVFPADGKTVPEADSLQWPTLLNGGNIEPLKVYGIPSGSVVRSQRSFINWGKASSLTWHVANNNAGEYKPTLTYRSSHDVACTLTIGDHTFEHTIKKGKGVLKHPFPPVLLDRIGVYPVTITVSSDDPEHDFELTDLRLKMTPADVAMSKPVLIAGGDWLKIQGSLEVRSKDLSPDAMEVRASIRPWPEGDVIWEGGLDLKQVAAGIELDQTITGLPVRRWAPNTPHLYQVTIEVRTGPGDEPVIRSLSRIGFRDFEVKDGRFYLNGIPVFLRGNSIIPPGGGSTRNLNPDVANDPDSIRAYLLKLKEFNVNLVRVHDPLWLSICDEVGMMVFTGRYGVPDWGNAKRHEPPVFEEGAVTYYKQHFAEAYMNYPSVVIWILTNEMPSAMSENGRRYIEFLRQCYEGLSEWDPTRAYIENAGFGLGQGGNVNDFHVYMGWYNGIVQSVYKFRYDLRKLAGIPSPLQPMAFTEIIGAYTDTLGRMPGTGKQVSAGLMWGGNASDIPEYALGYQNYLTREFLEILRRLRPINPTIAGTMPFTTTANEWEKANSVDEIQFKPFMTEGYVRAYQPVLLSFENWRPHVYAGEQIRISVHLVNDADDGQDLAGPEMQWRLVNEESGRTVSSGTLPFAGLVKHYSVDTRELTLEISGELERGQYSLKGDVVVDGKTVSSNETGIWVEPRSFTALDLRRKVLLFDPLNETRPLLEKAGMAEGKDFFMTTSPFASMKQFDRLSGSQFQETMGVEEITDDTLVAPSQSLFIVGSTSWVEPLRDNYLLMKEFVDRGGRVLFLHPTAAALNDIGIYREIGVIENEWMGDRVSVDLESLWHTSRNFGSWINPRRSDNAIFDGVDRRQLWLWSDTSDWNPDQPGLPAFEPVNTFMKLRDADALETTAVLANFGRGLEHLALAEVFRGEGSVILSGFDFARFAGFDPIADKVLRGIIVYAADDHQHHLVPEAKKVTNIGSPSDEDGLIPCEIRNGLLLEYDTDFSTGVDYRVRRIAGPFWFNRLCHTKFINPDEKIRHGFMHLRPPAGSNHVVFHARRVATRENRGRYKPEPLTVTLGAQTVQGMIEGEEDVEIRVPLPAGDGGPLRVDFEGVSDIGISRMSFE